MQELFLAFSLLYLIGDNDSISDHLHGLVVNQVESS